MTASELREWKRDPCHTEASIDPGKVVDRVIRLLETPKSEWGEREAKDALKVHGFIERMKEVEAGDAVCDGLSKRTIALLNWGFRPSGVDRP